jgi:hypothetical protein
MNFLKALVRLAVLLVSIVSVSISVNAQPWTLAGPDDYDQPGTVNFVSDDKRAMASDRGNGFYLFTRNLILTAPNTADFRANVCRWDGTSWQAVGTPAFSAGRLDYLDIAVAPGPKPYVVYRDYTAGRKTVVKTLNGNLWVDVGSPVSPGVCEYNSIAVDASGTPYVAYVDSAVSHKVTVKKWDGTTWQLVGASNFSPANASYLKLEIGSSGVPQLLILSATAEVFRYTGSTWISTGTVPGAVIGAADMALKGDTVFLAYTDGNFSGRLNVRKYNGSNWIAVGSSNFSPGSAPNVQIVADSIKGIYVYCTTDPAGGSNSPYIPMVRRFNGSDWVVAGPDSFVARRWVPEKTILKMDTSGAPYLMIRDYKNRLLKLSNGNWMPQGTTEGFSNGEIGIEKLAIAPNGKKAYCLISNPSVPINPYSNIYTYDTGWTLIAQSGVGGLQKNVIDFAIHPDGEPWVIVRDSVNFYFLSIWRHTSSGWVYAGLTDTCNNIAITIDGSGNVYVANEPLATHGIQVHKYTGGAWTSLPLLNPNFTYEFINVKVNSTGIPYLLAGRTVSTTPNYYYTFGVYKWNNSNWAILGSTIQSVNGTQWVGVPDMALDTADVPYIVYPNSSRDTAKVQKFNTSNNAWVDVVPPAAAPLYTQYQKIQFGPDGSLYLSYGDHSTTPLISTTVKRLSGSTWQTVGSSAFTRQNGYEACLAILNNRLLTTYNDGAAYAYKYDCTQPANILSQPRDTIICSGLNARFIVTASGATGFRWQYYNGHGWYNLQNNSTYLGVLDDTLLLNSVPTALDGIRFRCILSNACNGTNITDAATLRVDSAGWPAPSVIITADKPYACTGNFVTFHAAASNSGVLFSFEWRINGALVAGATDSIFTTNILNQGDDVTCKLTRSSACGLPAVSAISNPLIIAINPKQIPTVNISASPGTVIAAGQLVTFTGTVTNGGATPQLQWLLNSNPVAGANALIYNTNTLAPADVVSLQVTRNDTCATPNVVVSNNLFMIVWPVDVHNTTSAENIVVYPQPAHDHIMISSLRNITGKCTLELLDMPGHKIFENEFTTDGKTSTYQFLLPSSVVAGTYILKLKTPVKILEAKVVVTP